MKRVIGYARLSRASDDSTSIAKQRDIITQTAEARGWDLVDVVAAKSPRVGLVLKADIRPGYEGQLTAKVERVERHLAGGESS